MSEPAMRKTVTVLFCDLTGSTELGERLDPESLRAVMARWYAAMRGPLEHHGGTVEKFIGDAVMAVFGVPHVHEDDALRAVRAAVEMRAAVARLNGEFAAEGRAELKVRIGINSGEVITGDSSTTLVTGDAVNTAKRLEEAARAGEILIGGPTRRLVENAAILEAAIAVAAKGKSEPLEAWRVLGTIEGAAPVARRLDAPLVGRTAELETLHDELASAVREQACRVVTVYGAAGIGKSRLATELLAQVKDHATVLTARCLPYGDGITFLPLTELVRSAGGEQAIAAAGESEPDGALVLERVRGALGVGSPASSEETFWAIRRLLEALARERPLVACLEDVHWAQPTFLDLLEYIAGWSSEAPILLLCLARPDLLDARPRWGGAALTLDPLTDIESQLLLDELGAEWPLSAGGRARIAEAAEGNPLFLEQMVAMIAEDDAAVEIPPTIQALLAARLDRLEPLEHAVLERAAVIGKEFWRGAVAELSPNDERAGVHGALLSLVRKELVQPERSTFVADDGFRFRHALIRDAAYAEIPKSARAELHEQFADWLEHHDGEEELIGYHLEQAHRYRVELGGTGAAAAALAERAGLVLAAAGRRAYDRDDMPAAENLLDRALAVGDLGSGRAEALRDLAGARWAGGDVARAAELLDDAIEVAARTGDRQQEWYARLERAARRHTTRSAGDDLVSVAGEAVSVFESLGDDLGLARAWRRLGLVSFTSGRYADAAEQSERALQHAGHADAASEEARIVDVLCSALLFGPQPADAAARRCRELLAAAGTNRVFEAAVRSTLVGLEAMQGRFADARAEAAAAAAIYDELGLRMLRAGLSDVIASAELLAGDYAAAERELTFTYEVFEAAGAKRLLGLPASRLAALAVVQGRLADADELLAVAEGVVDGSDMRTVSACRQANARVAAATGRREDAVRFAEAAVDALSPTDALVLQGDALALQAAIKGVEPKEALVRYEQKGATAAIERLRVTQASPKSTAR